MFEVIEVSNNQKLNCIRWRPSESMTEFPAVVRDQPTDTEEKPMIVVMRNGNNGCGDPSGKRLVVEFVSRAHSLS